MSKVHIIHPGREISVYSPLYSKEKESAIYTNRNIRAFTSLSFGASDITLEIPYRYALLRHLYVDFELAASGTIGPMPAYNMISEVLFQVNSSSEIRQSGIQMMMHAMDQCETKEKRDQLITASGGPAATRVISASGEHVQAFIVLPWSSLRSLNKKPSFDANTAGGNIRIKISLRNASDIYTASAPSALVSAQWVWKSGRFSDIESYVTLGSLAKGVRRFYNFPTDIWQSAEKAYTSSTSEVSITLNGFRNAACKAIYCADLLNTDISTGKNRSAFRQLTNIKLELNGDTIYRSDNNEDRMESLVEAMLPNELEQPSGTLRPYHVITLAQFGPKFLDGHSSNSSRNFSGQELTLTVTNGDNGAAHTMILAYVYGASILADGLNAKIEY